jgi:uncharacterized protein YjbJ (UPF0337 family)
MKPESKERARGKAEEIAGKVQKHVGRAVGSTEHEAEGALREADGKGRQEAAKAAGRTRGAVQQIAGKAKKVAGRVLDDADLEAEGTVEDLEGKARRKANR